MVTTNEIDVASISKTKNGSGEGLDPTIVDVNDFFDRIVQGYNDGSGELHLPADVGVARSVIPAGTGAARDFSYIAPEIPEYIESSCTGCMSCVNQCPDTAILGKVVKVDVLDNALAELTDEAERGFMANQFAETNKFFKVPQKRKKEPGKFGIFIDPTKCKGCAECVEACADLGYNALKMIQKEDKTVPIYEKSINFFRSLPATPDEFINDRIAVDMMLAEQSMLYVGGAGSCAGCGEATVIRMWLAAL